MSFDTLSSSEETLLQNYRLGATKLRILGLSNPEKALKELGEALNSENLLKRTVQRFSQEAYEILGGETTKTVFQSICSTLVLRRDSLEDTRKLLGNSGFNMLRDTALFSKIWQGYHFEHRFINDTTNKMISCLGIDGKAIDETQDFLGEDFKIFEKSLGTLFTYMNHDATTHRYGIGINAENSGGNSVIERDLDFSDTNEKFLDVELAAAIFHKDMFENIDELGVPLKKSLLHNTRIFLTLLSQISNPSLQKYWISVLKYPLFSLLDPAGKEIQELQSEFPNISLRGTYWGKILHIPSRTYTIYSTKEKIFLPIRDVRKAMMPYFYSQTSGVSHAVAQQAGKQGGFPEVQNVSHLSLMSRAKRYGLPYDSSEERIQMSEDYHGFLLDMYLRDERETALDRDMDDLHDRYLLFQKQGFDIAEFEKLDWEKLIEKYFHEKLSHLIADYRRNGKDFEVAQKIDISFQKANKKGLSLSFGDFPEFFKMRREKLTTAIHQYMRLGDRFHSLGTLKKEYEILLGYGCDIGELGEIFLENENISS